MGYKACNFKLNFMLDSIPHECAVALHYMAYNFATIHKTLRVTPAMQLGIASHVWTLEEIAKLAG